MTQQQTKRISKFLSLILRHTPETIGLKLDKNGWANVSELMQGCAGKGVRFSREDLEEVVATNDKKRFAFNEDGSRIRANQGHSINVELNLKPQIPPEFLYHGTAERFLSSILRKGIKKMNRTHVHLSAEKETAGKVGRRHGRPVILTIPSGQMYRNGISFFCSDNGVWLTEYVSPEYIAYD